MRRICPMRRCSLFHPCNTLLDELVRMDNRFFIPDFVFEKIAGFHDLSEKAAFRRGRGPAIRHRKVNAQNGMKRPFSNRQFPGGASSGGSWPEMRLIISRWKVEGED